MCKQISKQDWVDVLKGVEANGNDASISENEKNDDTKFAEIKEYKELLDSGIITPEEFEKKKSELLDLSWNHNRRASWNQEALFLCP